MNIPGVKTKLLPHQLNAIRRIQQSENGLILAHGVGAGKTLSSIAAGNLLGKPVDAIVPAALVPNYQEQLRLHTTPKSVPFNVLSATAVTLDPTLIKNPEDKTLILDEAHKIRNEKSKLYDILVKAPYYKKILLTGTPIYNQPADVASLVNMIDKEVDERRRIIPSQIRRYFNDTLDATIKKELDNRLRIEPHGHALSSSRMDIYREIKNNPDPEQYLFNKYIDSSTPYIQRRFFDALTLRDMVRVAATVLARKKQEQEVREKRLKTFEQVQEKFNNKIKNFIDYYQVPSSKDYPDKVYEDVTVSMEPEQEEEYKRYFKKLPEALQNKITQNKLERLEPSQLQNPFLVYTRMISNNFKGNSPKIQRMIEDIKREPGKTVVYSNFLENGLYPLTEQLSLSKIPYRIFTGAESAQEKAKIVKDYNEDKIKVLALSSAGGEGLDLKRTKQIQIMEPHWNDSKIEQVIGRGARYKSHEGLPEDEKKVVIKKYLSTVSKMPQTTETYMRNMSEHKKELSQTILNMLK